jgi:hypothetical protein
MAQLSKQAESGVRLKQAMSILNSIDGLTSKDVDRICTDAIVYGYQAGLKIVKGKKCIDYHADWTTKGKVTISRLKEALIESIDLAQKLRLPGKASKKLSLEASLWATWGEMELSDQFIRDVFNVSLFYLPLRCDGILPMEYFSRYTDILIASLLINQCFSSSNK